MLMNRLLRSWFSRSDPRDRPSDTARTRVQTEHLTGGDWLVRGRHGLYVASDNDIYVGRALVHYGEFSELEWHFIQGYCRAGDTVVEVGAHIGAHTVSLAKAVGPTGHVVAIEPQPVVFRMLCANLALNGLQNVDTHLCGCGAAEATMGLPVLDYQSEKNFAATSLEVYDPASSGRAVPIRPLDDLLEGAPGVDLIKIDVEGMETPVLNGARRTIERFRPVLYVENDRVRKSQLLIETLMGMGYRMWWHVPPLFNPENYYGDARNLYSGVFSFNMLCLHRSSAVDPPAGLVEVTDATYHPLSRPPA